MCTSGIHTEGFAFDGYFVNEYADRPKPPGDETKRMVREFLADNPNKLRAFVTFCGRGIRQGLGFLKGLPNAMYYIAEAHDQAAPTAMMAELHKL